MAKTLVVNTATFQINIDIKNGETFHSVAIPPKGRITLEENQVIAQRHLNEFKNIVKTFQIEEEKPAEPKVKKDLYKKTNPNDETTTGE